MTLMLDSETLESCEALWKFMVYRDELKTIDTLIILGSTDIIVPAYAATLALKYMPKQIVCCGGVAHQGDLLETGWTCSEAEVFGTVLHGFGIPSSQIVLEKKSKNTGENIKRAFDILNDKGVSTENICLVHKPYMTLRTMLTCKAQFPHLKFYSSGPAFEFSEYCQLVSDVQKLINVMTGDFQRLIVYQEKGFIAQCEIPSVTRRHFSRLVQAGYDKHLIANY